MSIVDSVITERNAIFSKAIDNIKCSIESQLTNLSSTINYKNEYIKNYIDNLEHENQQLKAEVDKLQNQIKNNSTKFTTKLSISYNEECCLDYQINTIDFDIPEINIPLQFKPIEPNQPKTIDFIEEFDLRLYAARCYNNTLDLADPRFKLSGKYIKRCKGSTLQTKYLIKSIKSIDILNFKYCESLDGLFQGFSTVESIEGLENIDTSNVLSMKNTFRNCENLFKLNLSKWDTHNVKDMSGMFANCGCRMINTNNWDVSNVENMTELFADCNKLKRLNLTNWNTSKVSNMSRMFYGCMYLENLNINNWNVSNVENFSHMFNNCKYLDMLDLTNWNTQNATNMKGIFYNCEYLKNIDISKWNTENVKDINMMFDY